MSFLMVSERCPKCEEVKKYFSKDSIIYAEDNMDLAREYQIRAVPCLIVEDKKIVNPKKILDYAEKN